jgi:hypothetical protein
MHTHAIINNPGFFSGFIRHLQRLLQQFREEGDEARIAETVSAIRLLKMMLLEIDEQQGGQAGQKSR